MDTVENIFQFPDCFLTEGDKATIQIEVLDSKTLEPWLKAQDKTIQQQVKQQGFKGGKGQTCLIRSADGNITTALCGIYKEISVYTICPLVEAFKKLEADFINGASFEIATELNADELTKICIGWGWANYRFDAYKPSKAPVPKLVWPEDADEERAEAFINAVCLIRSLVNTPANLLNTNELSTAAENIAKTFEADFSSIVGPDLLDENFPMIYEVGKASENQPQLLEINWGNPDHPKLTLVGKGIVFDTGGLNIKTGQWMTLMKKDMGGSAHALGLAWMVMALELPVCLKVLISVAENSISGNAFRPGDIIQSRKGLSVEIKDTDAEGRLVVADALTYACEDKPDLLIDFCTLTGAARVALGYDIPAFFSNRQELLQPLTEAGMGNNVDPVWPLPLWEGYDREMDSDIADVANDSTMGRAGSIQAGLFLQRFIDPDVDWIHLDLYAWEQYGRPGRPKGGADTGMRAVFHLLEQRYGKAS